MSDLDPPESSCGTHPSQACFVEARRESAPAIFRQDVRHAEHHRFSARLVTIDEDAADADQSSIVDESEELPRVVSAGERDPAAVGPEHFCVVRAEEHAGIRAQRVQAQLA